MDRYAAAAVVVLATLFAAAAPGSADEASPLETIQMTEPSTFTATTVQNESIIAATVDTVTSASLESTLSSEFSSNETDISNTTINRFLEINYRAARDPVFQRREVQVLKCCLPEVEEDCFAECVNHFVESVETGGAANNETTPVLLCNVLYDLLGCPNDADMDACTEYCRCFSSDPWASAFWGAMSALFMVCMLLTLAVYACVPQLRNLHGKCLISYLVAVIAGEAVATVGSALVCGDPAPLVAATVGYLTLVRNCWVNLLCVDVYLTCRPFQSVRHHPRTGLFSRERRKFLYFSAAAWGGSALVCGLLKAFETDVTQIIYAGIIFLLLATSCVPLILTLVRIWWTKRQTKKKCLNISKTKLNWFYLTSKLLCLSGVGKLISVVLYFTVRGKPYYSWLFVVLKLEGPIILFMFVYNARVRNLVRKRLTNLEWISVEKSNDNCSNNKLVLR